MTLHHEYGCVRIALALAVLAVAGGACSRVIEVVHSEDCSARASDPDCAPTPWPIVGHSANSDPWIVSHHDGITQMSPSVLVLNFANGVTSDAAMATAMRQVKGIAQGSIYHGYSNPQAPAFLTYQIAKVVDLTDHPVPSGWTNPSSTQLPVTPTSGAFDPLALFSARYSAAYGFLDPTDSSRYLSLCELFEQGLINEVWIEDGETGLRRVPLNAERKQVYDAMNRAIPGTFDECVGGGGCLTDVSCRVTVRMAHLDPMRGPGCDLEVRGWGIAGMFAALPAYASTAATFLNDDFQKRFGVQFNGWENVCDSSAPTCVSYPTPTTATGTYQNGTTWTINPFTSSCGTADFPPNARQRWDWGSSPTPNLTPVQSNCEHFGLGDGVNGADQLEVYTSDKVAAIDKTFNDCGGGWQIYWRQNIPGLKNPAKTMDGAPMRNWWPLLFY
jgi:hypothetical protein